MNITLHKILSFLALVSNVLIICSCSTTKRLEDDEILYTGVTDIVFNAPANEKIISSVDDQILDAVNVKPNGSIISPYLRSPLQLGLWVYNWGDTTMTGFKRWIYNRLAKQPVLISDVKPDMRIEMINDILNNNGYFGSKAHYELHYNKHDAKQARINYNIDLTTPYKLNSVEFFKADTDVELYIDSLARAEAYLSPGNRYCTDSLETVRTNITNTMRNRGYYFFRPEYIEYLADTTFGNRTLALKLKLVDNIPPKAMRKYYIGNIETDVYNYFGRGRPDTTLLQKCTLIRHNPVRVRNTMISSAISMRKGRVFSVKSVERTQSNLSRLGIFSSVDINTTPLEEVTDDTIDVNVICKLDMPIETKFEVKAASKSNSYLGPSAVLGLTNKNIFGGGEQLTTELKFAYEWQTGKNAGNKLNSYEAGINFSLAFPRLLAPKFVDRSRRYINWTNISLNADIINRPKYFKMLNVSLGMKWEWHANRYSLNEFSPLTLKYTNLLSCTSDFLIMAFDNPAIMNSFDSQFLPMMTYSYTYDRQIDSDHKINWNLSLAESGNVLCGIWTLVGAGSGKYAKELIETPISQFVKASTQLTYSYQFFPGHWLVSRAFIGAAHAYGNSSEVPFSEQFYVGGSNSLRAFPARSVGPGHYHDSESFFQFYDQAGTFKLEMNLEYRFPIIGFLKGALFVDAGNVWLLSEDTYRPGAKITTRSFFKDIALGTGIGLRFDFGFIVVRGDLGIGIHYPYETEKSSYYNMSSFKNSLSLNLAIGYPF